MPPLFLFAGQNVSLNDGGVFFDADIALLLGGPGFGICLVGQEQPQAFSLLSDGAAWAQHVKDDHVAGVVTETLHGKLTLAGDYGVIFHRQAVLSFHFRAAKKPGRVYLSGVLSNVQLSFLAPLAALQPLIQEFEDRLLYPRGGVGFGKVFAELVQRNIDTGGLYYQGSVIISNMDEPEVYSTWAVYPP